MAQDKQTFPTPGTSRVISKNMKKGGAVKANAKPKMSMKKMGKK
jgi:hypothetical protein